MPGAPYHRAVSSQYVFTEEDLTDDLADHIPMNGSKNALNLGARFLDRLSRITAADARRGDDKEDDKFRKAPSMMPPKPICGILCWNTHI